MSRKDEDRILHGLHHFRESIDDEFTVTAENILWLAAHSYGDGIHWCRDGELQRFDSSLIPVDLRRRFLLARVELPLRYLQSRRLIKYTPAGEDVVNIAVTFAGADRAMRLHTRLGRIEMWYQEHRDGFLGIMTTIAVSAITALLAVAVAEHLHGSHAQPVRVLYEADPR